MREHEMFESMITYLKERGYNILQVHKERTHHGPDILVERGGRKLMIQIKGDSVAIKTDWDTGLGQLLDIMDDEKADYAMAVSKSYERLVKGFPSYAKDKLKLIFFIVNDNGSVKIVP